VKDELDLVPAEFCEIEGFGKVNRNGLGLARFKFEEVGGARAQAECHGAFVFYEVAIFGDHEGVKSFEGVEGGSPG